MIIGNIIAVMIIAAIPWAICQPVTRWHPAMQTISAQRTYRWHAGQLNRLAYASNAAATLLSSAASSFSLFAAALSSSFVQSSIALNTSGDTSMNAGMVWFSLMARSFRNG